eukprot:scaffold3665_cov102-Isochrysis_galbana.AAC.7
MTTPARSDSSTRLDCLLTAMATSTPDDCLLRLPLRGRRRCLATCFTSFSTGPRAGESGVVLGTEHVAAVAAASAAAVSPHGHLDNVARLRFQRPAPPTRRERPPPRRRPAGEPTANSSHAHIHEQRILKYTQHAVESTLSTRQTDRH